MNWNWEDPHTVVALGCGPGWPIKLLGQVFESQSQLVPGLFSLLSSETLNPNKPTPQPSSLHFASVRELGPSGKLHREKTSAYERDCEARKPLDVNPQ